MEKFLLYVLVYKDNVREEADHARQVGGRFKKQEKLLRRLS